MMRAVYRLCDDSRKIADVQRATLSTTEFGIAPTHGLFGSEVWWAHIATGTLEVHTLRGAITRVYMGSMGDWPEFEMRSDSGELSRWTREVNSAELAGVYAVGCGVELVSWFNAIGPRPGMAARKQKLSWKSAYATPPNKTLHQTRHANL
jgi:hypothetical protein